MESFLLTIQYLYLRQGFRISEPLSVDILIFIFNNVKCMPFLH